MIVFCITCRGRTPHLQRTLQKNITDNPGDFKFVVLDYNSTDNLLEFLKAEHSESILNGKLIVYSNRDTTSFRMAHAKNMVHRCGILEGGDILVNLDADNFTGPGFGDYVAKQFIDPKVFCWSQKFPGRMGISGRIVVSKDAFLNAGGYDEKFIVHSPDDMDFNNRLRRLGYVGRAIDPQFLQVILHSDKLRYREYPHANVDNSSRHAQEEVVRASKTTVVNAGFVGCGTVYRNFDGPAILLENIPTRIFGIGLHKTATSSLHKALTLLGINSAHWPSGRWARDIWNEMNTLGRSITLEQSYAASDLPISLLYEKLDKAYPGSKFILTVRDEAKWIESVRSHWSYEHNSFRWEWDVYPVSNKIHKALYGQQHFDAEVFLARYKRHNAEVKEYFKERPNDLLVMNMDEGEGVGWTELCKFLGTITPTCTYPKELVTV